MSAQILQWDYLRNWLNIWGELALKVNQTGAGELSQRLRALTIFPEDQSSIPSTYMLVHNCLQLW